MRGSSCIRLRYLLSSSMHCIAVIFVYSLSWKHDPGPEGAGMKARTEHGARNSAAHVIDEHARRADLAEDQPYLFH